jgi:hypothetical protein
MQFVLLIQVALGLSVFIGLSANGALPFHLLPMVLVTLGSVLISGVNLIHRLPGPHLEANKEALKDDRVVSLQVLVIIPLIAGAAQALSVMLSRQIALYASGGVETASAAALLTFFFSSYFASLSIKFDRPLYIHLKDLGKTDLISFGLTLLSAVLITLPFVRNLWSTGNIGSGFSAWIIFFSVLLSLLPTIILEWMKYLKNDDSANKRDS